MYALKSSEARRQYPKRLKMLFDYLKLQGPLEEQARQFLDNTMQKGIQWAQDSIMMFLDFHKERLRKKELAAGTLKNYYRASKLFCEMNGRGYQKDCQKQRMHLKTIELLQLKESADWLNILTEG